MRKHASAPVLLLVGALVFLAACGGGSTPPAKPTVQAPVSLPTATVPAVKQPNILVVETDDMRWDELTFMPNVQRLIGKRGLSFANSFAPYPLCCPSRASFLTGRYTHNHHVYSTQDPFAYQSFDDKVTLGTVLQGAGYQTALNGKYLNGYGRQHQYRSSAPSVRYVPPGWTEWLASIDGGLTPDSPVDGGTYRYFDMTQNHNGTLVGHPGVYSTRVLGQETRQLLTKFGKAKKPWFIWSTPVAPHFGSPTEPDDPKPVVDDKGIKRIFKTPARPARVRGIFDRFVDHPLGARKNGPTEADMSDKPRLLSKFPELNTGETKALTAITRQRAESLYVVDREIGQTLTTLKQTGQYDDTIVVFTSDNGYFLGEHRKPQGKIFAHEPSLRVPLLMAGPGIPHGTRYDPVTTVDLAPTFAAYAGLKAMPKADGHSLVPLIEQGDQGWDVPVVTEGMTTDAGYEERTRVGFTGPLNMRGIRTGRYTYEKYASGEVELYDLWKDPLQQESKQRDPAYDTVRAELDRVWRSYYDCAQAACQQPLPARFRVTAALEKRFTDAEQSRTLAYYDHPTVTYPKR